MATKIFIAYFESTDQCNNEYDNIARHFEKWSFCSHDLIYVISRVRSWIVTENIHEQQVEEISTHHFEPESGKKTNDASDERNSEREIDMSSSDE